MRLGMGLLATSCDLAFVGLFGTVWGIMNSFIGFRNRRPRILPWWRRHRRSAARHRDRSGGRHSRCHHLQSLRPRDQRLSRTGQSRSGPPGGCCRAILTARHGGAARLQSNACSGDLRWAVTFSDVDDADDSANP